MLCFITLLHSFAVLCSASWHSVSHSSSSCTFSFLPPSSHMANITRKVPISWTTILRLHGTLARRRIAMDMVEDRIAHTSPMSLRTCGRLAPRRSRVRSLMRTPLTRNMPPGMTSCCRSPTRPWISELPSVSMALTLTSLPILASPSFNGWGLTVVESLDTMWLMGLYDEFDEALSVVANTSFALQPVSHCVLNIHCSGSPERSWVFLDDRLTHDAHRTNMHRFSKRSSGTSAGCSQRMRSPTTRSFSRARTSSAPCSSPRSTPRRACQCMPSIPSRTSLDTGARRVRSHAEPVRSPEGERRRVAGALASRCGRRP